MEKIKDAITHASMKGHASEAMSPPAHLLMSMREEQCKQAPRLPIRRVSSAAAIVMAGDDSLDVRTVARPEERKIKNAGFGLIHDLDSLPREKVAAVSIVGRG